MKTFQDLMKENPAAVTNNTGTHTGTTSDTICRWYNMWWGNLTDTHMMLMDDGTYVVTGSRLTKPLWNEIMWNRILRSAPNTPLPHTWNDVMMCNHMTPTFTTHNGQFAVALGFENGYGEEHCIPPATSVVYGTVCSRGC